MRRSSVLALLVCSAVALPASGSNFWEQQDPPRAKRDAKKKTPRTFDELVGRADKYTKIGEQYRAQWFHAAQQHQHGKARALMTKARESAKNAIRYYDKALKLRPDDADLHYRCGKLTYTYLYEYYSDKGPRRLRDEAGAHAVEHWDAFERLAPDDPRRTAFAREGNVSWDQWALPDWAQGVFDPQTYQFARSIYYTKLGGDENYEKAIEDYDFLLESAPRNARTARWVSRLLTNSAEIHMALGNLDEAVERYREGVEYASHRSEALYRYGLAVALDRAGEKESAMDQMQHALGLDPKMEQLSEDGVFFIPDGDVHYYYGLAHEAQGNTRQALSFYRNYVELIKDKRYVDHAADRIERLTKPKEKKRRR